MNGKNYSHMGANPFEESATMNAEALRKLMEQFGGMHSAFGSWSKVFGKGFGQGQPHQQQRQSNHKEGQLDQIKNIVRSFGVQLGAFPERHIEELVTIGVDRDDADTLLIAALQEYIQRSRDDGRPDDSEYALTQEPNGSVTSMIISKAPQTERSKEYTTTFTTWGD